MKSRRFLTVDRLIGVSLDLIIQRQYILAIEKPWTESFVILAEPTSNAHCSLTNCRRPALPLLLSPNDFSCGREAVDTRIWSPQ